jgi:HK97 family phage portal protein
MSKWSNIRDAAAVLWAALGPTPSPQAAAKIATTTWGGIDWSDWVRGNLSVPGVSEESVRTVTAVHACVALIGGSIAAMPLHLYQRAKINGKDSRKKYIPPLWWLLNERPHQDWTAAAMWQYISDSRLLHGDAFVRIHRSSIFSAEPTGFEPLHPDYVDVMTDGDRRAYYYRDKRGLKRPETLLQEDILHIPGAGYDGVRSMSALRFGLMNAAGISLAADEQSKQFFSDGVRADFAIEIPNAMTPESQDRLRKTFLDRHAGTGAKRAPIVLAGGMKLHQLTMTSEDAQMLATRSFQIEEICRIFGVPPFMIGHMNKSTSWGTGIEQMGIGFNKYTLAPHLTAIEQEINHKLFKTSRNFCEFVTAGLERGDIKTRYESYRIGLGRAGEKAWLTVNDVRGLENMEPVDSGDDLNEPPDPATTPDPAADPAADPAPAQGEPNAPAQ